MRVALYARVSTKDKGQDAENQLRELREFAAKQGWAITAEFVDSESGSKGEKDRPQFREMFNAASQRKFDMLLFWSLDRLSREGVLQTLQYLNRLETYGVNYRSYTESYFDSCGIFRDAVISIMATLAKQERIRISERVKAGIARRKSQGKRFGGRIAKRLDMENVARMREAGASMAEIAKALRVSPATICNRIHLTRSDSV
jgi:DNA invertase Pin-like site-specific DNA recombinase